MSADETLKSSLVLRDFKVRSEENISAQAPFLRINTDKPKKPTYTTTLFPLYRHF